MPKVKGSYPGEYVFQLAVGGTWEFDLVNGGTILVHFEGELS